MQRPIDIKEEATKECQVLDSEIKCLFCKDDGSPWTAFEELHVKPAQVWWHIRLELIISIICSQVNNHGSQNSPTSNRRRVMI